MKPLLLSLALLLTGCAQLPSGSYARLATGYGKDGPSGKAVLHIPLGTRLVPVDLDTLMGR